MKLLDQSYFVLHISVFILQKNNAETKAFRKLTKRLWFDDVYLFSWTVKAWFKEHLSHQLRTKLTSELADNACEIPQNDNPGNDTLTKLSEPEKTILYFCNQEDPSQHT